MTVPPAVPVPHPVIDVDLVAVAVRACPLVADLHGGPFGEVATYLPRRRVIGIRATVTALEIHVIGRFPAAALQLAAQVRVAVAPWAGGLPVDVVLEDILLPGELLPGEEPAPRDPPPPGPPATPDTAPPPAAEVPPPAVTVTVESDADPAVLVESATATVSVRASDDSRAHVSVEAVADGPVALTIVPAEPAGPDPAHGTSDPGPPDVKEPSS